MFSKVTLTDDIIERIRKVKGVRSVEPLSMAQVSIENRVINLAAVDPATYRNYTRSGVRTSRSSGTGSPPASSPS